MADPGRDLIEIEVVYALPQTQTVVTLKVPRGTTVGEAIERSGIAAQDAVAVGIHGRRVAPSAVLREHDRIEIYRPLIADEKQLRRKRARRRNG